MQFNKLALAAAVASAPTAGMAMEPMQDAEMADVTGQDGINIAISNVNLAMNVGIEDTDGDLSSHVTTTATNVNTGVTTTTFSGGTNTGQTTTTFAYGSTASTYNSAGLLLIQNQKVRAPSDINIEMDVGDNGTVNNLGKLEVRVNIPTLELKTGNIYASEGTNTGLATTAASITAGVNNVNTQAAALTANDAILESTSVTINNLDLTIELGEEETDFLTIQSSSTLTVTMGTLTDATDNFTLNDANGSSISMGAQQIRNIDFGTTGISGNVIDAGLQLQVGSDALTSVDMAMMGVTLGNPGATATDNNDGPLGNVYVTGLDLSGTQIEIAGH